MSSKGLPIFFIHDLPLKVLLQIRLVHAEPLSSSQATFLGCVSVLQVTFVILVNANVPFIASKLNLTKEESPKNVFILSAALLLAAEISLSLMIIASVSFYMLRNFNEFLVENLEGGLACPFRKLLKITTAFYDNLCDALIAVTQFYAVFLVLFLSILINFSVLSAFTFYIFLKMGGTDIFLFFVTTISWATVWLPFVIWVIAFSSGIYKESSNTVDLIHRLATVYGNKSDTKAAHNFALLASHRRPQISCGLFEFDWKLLFSLIGCVFSFTLIVIQFSDV